MKLTLMAGLLAVLAMPAFAQDAEMTAPTGDACHVVVDDAGETLADRNAQTGPNLYNVVARGVGRYPDFDYSESMQEFGGTGAMWTEEHFVAYVQNPTDFLREELDNRRARGAMSFQLPDAGDAVNVDACLASLAAATP